MRNAKNGIGWEIQYYSLTTGWKRSIVVDVVFDNKEEAVERLGNLNKEFYRIYEALYAA